ncbi:MAG: NDP-sugar synthase [Candidatus Moraniibacteriota bacterium]|jgi:NDP-sugar pyrophosphorylase family protein
MYAVILVAGLGTRMGELTQNCPKPMLKIKDSPKLAYSIELLPDEITDVVLVVGYLSNQIIDYFGDVFDNRKIHYIKQVEFNGTAGAIALTKDIVKNNFLVIMGDDLYDKKDLNKLMKYEQSLLAYETNDAEQFGLVDIDTNSDLTDVIERPHGKKDGLVNTGAYMLSQKYLDIPMVRISEREYGLPQTLVSMYPKYKTKVVTTKKWQSIGSPEDLEIAQTRIEEFLN